MLVSWPADYTRMHTYIYEPTHIYSHKNMYVWGCDCLYLLAFLLGMGRF